jgi:hypothetical protein
MHKFRKFIFYRQYKIPFLKNKHSNKRAFIIGNGPSLAVDDLELRKDEITFAANKIWLLFNQTEWRPTYYSITDRLEMRKNKDNINKVSADLNFFPCFMVNEARQVLSNSIYFNNNPDSADSNLQDGLDIGPTVVYTLIRISIYMGFHEICLLGLDHNYMIPDQYRNFKKGDNNIIISEGEMNHFHKDYRKKGEEWAQPELELLEKYYVKIKKYAEKHNIKIYNASRSTKLEVFEKNMFG